MIRARITTESGRRASDGLVPFRDSVIARASGGVERSAVLLLTQVQNQLSTPGKGLYYAKRRADGGGSAANRATFNRKLSRAARRANAQGGLEGIALAAARKLHRASAPGDSPAPDTGEMKRSAFVERVNQLAMRVGVAAAQSVALEFGTKRVLPRPYMRPALAKVLQALGARFTAVLTSGS